jgi:ribonuclease R
MIDTIEKNGLFFRLSKDKQTFFDKQSMKIILPGDVVEYTVNNDNLVSVLSINRKKQYALGILYGKTVSLGMLSKHYIYYDKKLQYNPEPKHCLFLIDEMKNSLEQSITIVKEYTSVSSRIMDKIMFSDLFLYSVDESFYLNTKFDISKPLYKFPEDYNPDQTNLYTFSIDPEYSKDFDDAISVDTVKHILYVHIVDIVKGFSMHPEIEKQAFLLGNTLYLYEEVINMLPKELAEYDFSLIANQNRNVITVEMHIDKDNQYNVKDYYIYPSTIKIKRRYSYETALLDIENDNLKYLANMIRETSSPYWRYSINNVSRKTFKLDATGKIKNVVSETPNIANKIIEALMIKANTIVSEHITEDALTSSFVDIILERYHKKNSIMIPQEKISEMEFIDCIRKLHRAKYSDKESGHYALNLTNYTHFTSPIRRAFDILVHKTLAGIIAREPGELIDYINYRDELTDRIDKYYRQLKLLSLFQENLNELKENTCYSAMVIQVSGMGIRFLIEGLNYDDFIHIAKINSCRWVYEEECLKSGSVVLSKGCSIELKLNEINWLTQTPIFTVCI